MPTFTLTISNIIQQDPLNRINQYKLVIKYINGNLINEIQVSEAVGLKVNVQFEDKLQMIFSVLNQVTFVGREMCFAEGCVIILRDQIDNSKKMTAPLFIKNSNLQIATIQFFLIVEDQKVGWHLQNSGEHDDLLFEDDSAIERITQKVVRRNQSSVLRSKYKKDKVRHLQYKIRDQLQNGNIQIKNKMDGNCNLLFQNFKFIDFQQKVQYIGVRNGKNKQIIGQIFCQQNPTAQQLDKITLKCPIGLDQIQILIITKDKNKYQLEATLDELHNKQVKAVGLALKNQKNQKKGNFWFNYTINQQQNSLTATIDLQKSEILGSLQQQQSQPNKYEQLPNSLRILQLLQKGSRRKQKIKRTQQVRNLFRIQLPPRKENRSTLTSKTVDQKIMPFSSPKKLLYEEFRQSRNINYLNNRDQYTSHRQRYGSLSKIQQNDQDKLKNSYKHKLFQQRQLRNLKRRKQLQQMKKFIQSRTIQKNRTIQSQTLISKNIQFTYLVKISQLDIKFYTSYMTDRRIQVEKESRIGKFLHIYSNQSQIYRSDIIYGAQHLSWVLRGCEIQIKPNKKLTLQVCSMKQNKKICSTEISFEQLKMSQQQSTFYKGHILRNNQYIAKIIVVFTLKESQKYILPKRYNQNIQYHSPSKNRKKLAPILQSK